MPVVITKTVRCAPEGHTVVELQEGQEVTGKVADYALEKGFAKQRTGPGKKKSIQPDYEDKAVKAETETKTVKPAED